MTLEMNERGESVPDQPDEGRSAELAELRARQGVGVHTSGLRRAGLRASMDACMHAGERSAARAGEVDSGGQAEVDEEDRRAEEVRRAVEDHYGACAGMDSNPRVGAGGGRDRRGDAADVEEAQGPQEEAPLGAGADEEGRLGWG